MGTAVGIRGNDGVAVAADRRVLADGQVRSDDVDHLYTVERLAIATVGPPAAVQTAHRELDAALRQYRLEHDRPIHATPARRIVSDVASDAGVSALLGVPDSDGEAILVRVDADGGVSEETDAAVGEGAAAVLGLLDSLDREADAATLAGELDDVLRTAAERETTIGEAVDTATIADQA